MRQNFTKTIQGHQLEFNKQLGIGSYNVSSKNVDFKSILLLQKDEKGMWNVNETEPLPAWFNEISMYIHHAIQENETNQNKDSGLFQFAYPF